MQRAASTSLVLTDSSSFKRFADSHSAINHGRFYQRVGSELVKVIHTNQTLADLGQRLIVLAEHAHAYRQMDALEQVSQFLVNSPLPRQYEAIGQYYQALCTQMLGSGDVERAASLLEAVAEGAPPKYMIRAVISLAANFRYRGDNESALSVYCEAGRFASRNNVNDPYSIITAQRMFGVIRSEDGDHRGALALLENLFPLAHAMRSSQPHVYYDYMNSLAVELCEAGRLEEAKSVSQIVMASAFAPAYPEWHETREQIELRGRRASRSTIGVSHSVAETRERIGSDESSIPPRPSSVLAEFAADPLGVSQGTAEASNILRFPVREQGVCSGFAPSSIDTREPARVLIMSERNLGKEANETQANKSYEDLDGRQLLLKIMELTAATDTTDYELLEILKSIESILYGHKDPVKR